MGNREKNVFIRQGYEAPHAESIAVAQESILCASVIPEGQPEDFTETFGNWG